MEGNNGKLTDVELLKISDMDIQDIGKYSDDDRTRRQSLLDTERAVRFNKDPNSFLEIKAECIACMIRTPQGPMIYLAGTKMELDIAWAELNRGIIDRLRQMDLEAAMKKAPKIHAAGDFFQGLKGLKHKKH